ncbi:TPA: glycosyltransferase family 4 protein [Enterobacter hormaechei subsp. steigerwaltii]|nr:glycosyltransferase family 4 protein [Enterobacter hormaechei subsp. steigerwaltii]HED2280967.1 glycosyltransferase family 4 protein [Enterobacter hormaechei subsp. steigerwaltii]HED3383000.1 glycosyltransferase family 4 protein [Enterobacter hormaechei subsp. steigerwaltii]HED3420221.1 glycosyltransferase family 4 protein [Enterobacter hormaechei subsp. steigerwaltii]HED3566186.1 glycosyltransferase family 4 protein [Enterobacter hormaechei subsp. steigerwaltii]
MKKLSLFISTLTSGGAERVCSTLANRLSRDYDVEVFSNTRMGVFYQFNDSINVADLGFNFGDRSILVKILDQVTIFRTFMKVFINGRKEPDTVFVSFLTEFNLWFAFLSIFFRNQSVILCEHNNYYAFGGKLRRFVRNILYYCSAAQITVLTSRDILNYPSIFQGRLRVMPNPIVLDTEHKRTSGVDNGEQTIRLLTIGRLTEQKGYDRLISIMAKLSEIIPDGWVLNIYGSGELEEKIIEMIYTHNLQDKVILNKPNKRIEEAYFNSDIYVMTSYWEGLPMVLGEAMVSGLPIITYDCPTGPREMIEDCINGYLIENGNEKQYLDRLVQLVSCSHTRESLSKAGIRAAKKWSLEAVYSEWKNLLREI